MEHNYVFMIVIMTISGLLSSMYIWANRFGDIRLSINDLYMILLMTGWMIFFMTLSNGDYYKTIYVGIFIIAVFFSIRNQQFITKSQYFTGMIPHHSMAVLMSRQLLKNDSTLTPEEMSFVKSIIKNQEEEIRWMKMRS